MSKQDRTPVRTAPDLERKYKFGQDLSEVISIANNANRAATNAQSVANNAASAAAEATATANGIDAKATEALSTAKGVANGLSVVNGLLCITYEG